MIEFGVMAWAFLAVACGVYVAAAWLTRRSRNEPVGLPPSATREPCDPDEHNVVLDTNFNAQCSKCGMSKFEVDAKIGVWQPAKETDANSRANNPAS